MSGENRVERLILTVCERAKASNIPLLEASMQLFDETPDLSDKWFLGKIMGLLLEGKEMS